MLIFGGTFHLITDFILRFINKELHSFIEGELEFCIIGTFRFYIQMEKGRKVMERWSSGWIALQISRFSSSKKESLLFIIFLHIPLRGLITGYSNSKAPKSRNNVNVSRQCYQNIKKISIESNSASGDYMCICKIVLMSSSEFFFKKNFQEWSTAWDIFYSLTTVQFLTGYTLIN